MQTTCYFIYFMLLANADRLVTNFICADFRYLCRSSSFYYLWSQHVSANNPLIFSAKYLNFTFLP